MILLTFQSRPKPHEHKYLQQGFSLETNNLDESVRQNDLGDLMTHFLVFAPEQLFNLASAGLCELFNLIYLCESHQREPPLFLQVSQC